MALLTRRTEKNGLRAGEVARVLGLSQKNVRTMAERGDLPSQMVNGRRWFPRAAIEAKALRAKMGRAKGTKAASDGALDSEAVRMMDRGSTDAEIVRDLELPLSRVEALRRARGEEPASAAPPPAPSGVREASEPPPARISLRERRLSLVARREAIRQKFQRA